MWVTVGTRFLTAIIMRIAARVFFPATEVTQGPLLGDYDAHVKRTPKPRCAICSGFEDTAKMSPRSRGTCLGDLAGDLSAFSVANRGPVLLLL